MIDREVLQLTGSECMFYAEIKKILGFARELFALIIVAFFLYVDATRVSSCSKVNPQNQAGYECFILLVEKHFLCGGSSCSSVSYPL